ncbi:hypothetical protein IAI10_23390 [Clostridium sp. 19966]|uniref:hypothetical protein n=1 Tax=Clostridium sp. 19966 TaxID=2768166 RepID=UPI0028E06C1F|nr:hypothetical protein [Clostridium sp. 19966]MDT8719591.1 hypothetical protein [Clostridium sp. 19966]
MKTKRKGLKMLTFIVSALIIAPMGLSAKVAKAEDNLPKYLNTTVGGLYDINMYKDKASFGVLVGDDIKNTKYQLFYSDHGKMNVLYTGTDIETRSAKDNMVNLLCYDEGSYYSLDLNDGKMINKSEDYKKIADKVKEKYNRVNDGILCYEMSDNWYRYSMEDNYGYVTPNGVVVENLSYFSTKEFVSDGKLYEYATFHEMDESQNLHEKYYITQIDVNGNVNKYTANFDIPFETEIVALKISGNSGEMITRNEKDNNKYNIISIDLKDNKLIAENTVVANGNNEYASVDHNGNLWQVHDGIVEKFENGKWIGKYEVNNDMDSIKAYDDDNIIVYVSNRSSKPAIYTIINNAAVIAPQQPKTPNVQINSIQNGVLPITVNSVNKDAENIVDAANSTGFNDVELTIASGKDVKNGTGSLTVKAGANTVIKLPFSAIDASLLTDTAKIVLKATSLTDSDILKGLKDVKKVFEFDLSVVDGAKTTAIHNFANGTAEISLNLSDEDLKGLNKSNLAVFYYNESTKQFEQMDTTVNGNTITFKTPHFSQYVVAEKSSTNSKLPQTGAIIDSTVLEATGLIFVLAGCLILVVGRKKVN